MTIPTGHGLPSLLLILIVTNGTPSISVAQVGGSSGGLGGRPAVIPPGSSNRPSQQGIEAGPVVHPGPSLTTSEILNPNGSLSRGQVIQPEGSLNRPRSGIANPTSQIPIDHDDPANRLGPNNSLRTIPPIELSKTPPNMLAGGQLRDSALALKSKLHAAPAKLQSKVKSDLDRLIAVAPDSNAPTKKEHRELKIVASSLRILAISESAKEITVLPEFSEIRRRLNYYLASAEDRRIIELQDAFVKLRSDLASFDNGTAWADYLMPSEFSNPGDQLDPAGKRSRALLKRYQSVSTNPELARISELQGFSLAHRALEQFVQETDASTSPTAQP